MCHRLGSRYLECGHVTIVGTSDCGRVEEDGKVKYCKLEEFDQPALFEKGGICQICRTAQQDEEQDMVRDASDTEFQDLLTRVTEQSRAQDETGEDSEMMKTVIEESEMMERDRQAKMQEQADEDFRKAVELSANTRKPPHDEEEALQWAIAESKLSHRATQPMFFRHAVCFSRCTCIIRGGMTDVTRNGDDPELLVEELSGSCDRHRGGPSREQLAPRVEEPVAASTEADYSVSVETRHPYIGKGKEPALPFRPRPAADGSVSTFEDRYPATQRTTAAASYQPPSVERAASPETKSERTRPPPFEAIRDFRQFESEDEELYGMEEDKSQFSDPTPSLPAHRTTPLHSVDECEEVESAFDSDEDNNSSNGDAKHDRDAGYKGSRRVPINPSTLDLLQRRNAAEKL